jgi:hypothetical protein
MGVDTGSTASQRPRAPRSPRLADLVIRAGAIYALTDRHAVYRSIALAR